MESRWHGIGLVLFYPKKLLMVVDARNRPPSTGCLGPEASFPPQVAPVVARGVSTPRPFWY